MPVLGWRNGLAPAFLFPKLWSWVWVQSSDPSSRAFILVLPPCVPFKLWSWVWVQSSDPSSRAFVLVLSPMCTLSVSSSCCFHKRRDLNLFPKSDLLAR